MSLQRDPLNLDRFDYFNVGDSMYKEPVLADKDRGKAFMDFEWNLVS